jgi:DNA-binding response OmpR family regulator
MGRILIFEDDVDIAELYRMELEDRGHQVLGIHADPEQILPASPEEARSMAPDILLLDDRLGSVSGVGFLPRFRKMFPGARILIISADPDALHNGLAQGVDGVVQKPVLLKRLMDDIDALLARPA